MPCEEYEALIAECLDGTLSADRRAAVEGHIAACPSCSEVLSTYQSLDAMLTVRLGSLSLPKGFEQRLLRQIGRPRPRWLPWADAAGYAALAVSGSLAFTLVQEALSKLFAAYG
ncbi:MAG: hypothetical protein GY953_40870 [bacterium]|nr:hypothetical protein [bacterium]